MTRGRGKGQGGEGGDTFPPHPPWQKFDHGKSGTEGKGNLVDKAVATLDIVFKASLNKHLSIGLNGMNLLNPNIVRSQEVQNVDVLTYKKGTNVNLSLSYNF